MPGPEINLQIYDDEAALLAGLRQGDADACTCLVKRFAPQVYARALQLVADSDEAENVLQQTFISACARFANFEGRSGLGTWLYRIATNEALMILRRRSSTDTPLETVGDVLVADDMPQNRRSWHSDPAHLLLDGELRSELERALAQLPESLRVVFVLRELQGLSTDEVAEMLGLGTSAVKVRLHRARLRLRELLTSYFSGA